MMSEVQQMDLFRKKSKVMHKYSVGPWRLLLFSFTPVDYFQFPTFIIYRFGRTFCKINVIRVSKKYRHIFGSYEYPSIHYAYYHLNWISLVLLCMYKAWFSIKFVSSQTAVACHNAIRNMEHEYADNNSKDIVWPKSQFYEIILFPLLRNIFYSVIWLVNIYERSV